jgi:peptidoglycan/LPS O-acetylase OafA/YrhL
MASARSPYWLVASHTFPRAEGGFLGVDVFFVLSGYLITSLLIKERAFTGRTDFVGFYRRRVARLAPAYLLMLALTVPMMLGRLAGQAAWPVPMAVDSGALGPLHHTWSLSIEEQFYLIWPIVFVTVMRRSRPLRSWLGGAAVLSAVIRAVGWWLVPGIWPYFATVTHADGFLIGCLVAVLLGGKQSAASPLSATAGGAGRRRGVRRPAVGQSAGWAAATVLAGLMLVSRIEVDGRTPSA